MKHKKRTNKIFSSIMNILKFLLLGYLLMILVQAIVCGKQPASVCRAWTYFIPVWIIVGIILLVYCRKK